MRLLLTRPEPDNARTAALLRAAGHDVVLAPLLRIEPDTTAELGPPPWSAVLITSANAARSIAGHPRCGELTALPVLAVGHGSAEAARAAGFADVTSAEGNASDLARLVARRVAGAPHPLLYLAGEDRSGELDVPGLVVRTVVVYRAAKAKRLPDAVQDELNQVRIDGVLHFSRRTAECYVECGGTLAGPTHYCLSGRVAEPLRRAGAARVQVATQPNEPSLLGLVTPKS